MQGFHHIRLELAREPGHPQGDARDGWDIVAPLNLEGRLDLAACRAEPQRCYVRRFVRDATIATGRLRHTTGDRWLLDMEGPDDLDATALRLADEVFAIGEYISIVSAGGHTRTYGVERLEALAGASGQPHAKT